MRYCKVQGHRVVFARACKQSGDFEITLAFGWKEHVGSVKVSGNHCSLNRTFPEENH